MEDNWPLYLLLAGISGIVFAFVWYWDGAKELFFGRRSRISDIDNEAPQEIIDRLERNSILLPRVDNSINPDYKGLKKEEEKGMEYWIEYWRNYNKPKPKKPFQLTKPLRKVEL